MMKRWIRIAATLLALVGLPVAVAADSAAQAKDRLHEKELRTRMKARSAKDGKLSKMNNKQRADQAADATRVGGARAARIYHGGVHATRKGVNKLSKKTDKATK